LQKKESKTGFGRLVPCSDAGLICCSIGLGGEFQFGGASSSSSSSSSSSDDESKNNIGVPVQESRPRVGTADTQVLFSKKTRIDDD
jgi:hypothetical protein